LCLFFIVNPAHPTRPDCGKVISKSQDEVVIKYGTETKLYLNVQFDKEGFKAVNVSPTTYFDTKNGKRVCFDLYLPVSDWYMLRLVFGILFLIVGGVIAIGFFVAFLIGPDKEE
jgi:hypothetical protein